MNFKTATALPEMEYSFEKFNLTDELLMEGEILDLIPENDPRLYEPTVKWDFSRPEAEARKLYLDLARTMRENGGIGLSANQVGLPYSVFVLEGPGVPLGVFNPVIASTSGEPIYLDEGCLSFRELVIKVKRPPIVRVRFAEWNGDVVTKQFEGMTARCVQHEFDHLQGVTFKQRANPIHLERALRHRKQHQKLINQHRV